MESMCQHIHTTYNIADLSKVLPWQGQGPFQGCMLLRAEEQAMATLCMSGQFPHASFSSR